MIEDCQIRPPKTQLEITNNYVHGMLYNKLSLRYVKKKLYIDVHSGIGRGPTNVCAMFHKQYTMYIREHTVLSLDLTSRLML